MSRRRERTAAHRARRFEHKAARRERRGLIPATADHGVCEEESCDVCTEVGDLIPPTAAEMIAALERL